MSPLSSDENKESRKWTSWPVFAAVSGHPSHWAPATETLIYTRRMTDTLRLAGLDQTCCILSTTTSDALLQGSSLIALVMGVDSLQHRISVKYANMLLQSKDNPNSPRSHKSSFSQSPRHLCVSDSSVPVAHQTST